MSDDNCTQYTCPVSESIYKYRPSMVANAIFLALFAVSAGVHALQGAWFRTWSFMIAMALGCALETAGYAGRIMMAHDPFSDPGFKLQVVLLTFAPAFLAAGIYFTLKHIVIVFGQDFSRLKPQRYTQIFITCDVLSIILQGTGGGLASGASKDTDSLLKVGDGVMIAGLAFQVFTLVVFGLLAGEYAWRVRKNQHLLNPQTIELRTSRKFRWFLIALTVSYSAILIRCIYRVAELAGGWGNDIMANQTAFIVLDSVMCVIAAFVLNAFHPGPCFNYRSLRDAEKSGQVNYSSDNNMSTPAGGLSSSGSQK